jgi:probable HAF family extracellular repeat protein
LRRAATGSRARQKEEFPVETIFQICLSNTIGALFVAAAAILAGALGRRPAVVHCLWVLVLVKLLAPPLFPVPLWSAPHRSPPAQTRLTPGVRGEADAKAGQGIVAAERPDSSASRTAPPARVARAAASTRSSTPPLRPRDLFRSVASRIPSSSYGLALSVWLGIAVSWWGWTSWRVWKFNRLLRWARPAPEEAQDQVRGLAPRLGLHRAPEVWFVPVPISPMVWTLGARPRILVPDLLWDRLGADQRAALLVHEMAHLRRRDHWVRLLEFGVGGLYWWHPLVWWSRRSLRDAEERCCDAWVVRTFPDQTRAYALAILDTLDCLAGAPALEPVGGTGLASARHLQSRLSEILGGRAPRRLSRPATIAFLGVAATALALGPAYATPLAYKAMDLGSLGGQSVTGFRLNNRGQVVGWATVGDNPNDPTRRRFAFHAFRTAPNRPIDPSTDDLAILIGDKVSADAQFILACAINNLGQVTVWAQAARPPRTWSSPPSDLAFLIDGARVVELGPGLAPTPLAVNDSGQVAGFIRQQGRPSAPLGPSPLRILRGYDIDWVPFRDTDWIAFRAPAHQQVQPARDDLGHLRGRSSAGLLFTIARDINARGQVTGYSVMPDRSFRAFRTRPDRPIDPLTDDLGTFAGPGAPSNDRGMSRARAVNDLGQVVGAASERMASGHRAFRTSPDRPIDPAADDLGTLGGENSDAWGINNRGDVVGEAEIASDPTRPATHAFLFTKGRMIDLNHCVELEPGWVLACALDINERGQIVAAARQDTVGGGRALQRAFLLTPAPAPAPLALLIVGAAVTGSGLALRHRRAEAACARTGDGQAGPPSRSP